MKDWFKTLISLIGIVLIACILGWIVQGSSFFMYKMFAPAQEEVRREVFEQTKAYNQGMSQDISNFQQQYATASNSQKDALASVIIHRTADYDLTKLQPYQREFIEKLRRGER